MSRLLLLFITVPLVEMMTLVYVSKFIGLGGTLLLIVFTGVIGASLARMQGLEVLREIQNNMAKGNPPALTLVEGLLVLIGGIVLLTPGILTDALGFSLMIPKFRKKTAQLLSAKFKSNIKSGINNQFYSRPQKPQSDPHRSHSQNPDDVIDV